MSDIFGRSISKPADTITMKQIVSMIKKYVTSGLNLVDVDPGEIVVFQDRQGKLKTSNLSITDLKDKFNNIKDINDSLVEHMRDYKQFRKNIIAKFFGTPLVVTPSLAEVKKSIDDIKQDITDIKKITDKVKIPHRIDQIENLVYVIQRNHFIFIQGGNNLVDVIIYIGGIYRFTVVSEHQFNITANTTKTSGSIILTEAGRGINTISVLLEHAQNIISYIITPVDPTVVRTRIDWYLEYVSAIKR